ncbi:GNAT family N-acetyltransferase [Streptomyces abyssomicinicus]|uniref:GNAT family N-acetyltransferase n=1 Tax=Streptomyces abyssomicinicus TaxID=574929 RepID=UPI00125089DA|nr:GNAT family N-acetyltransferase [Streptomyces abyssomicinicus]
MTELLPFDPAHSAAVAGWPASATEAVLWCGAREFPVPARTVDTWRQDDDVHAFGLYDEGRLLAYGEVWHDTEEDEAELARLIVDPGARGRGVGRELVRALAERAGDAGFEDVFLRVHPDNERAIRCYRGAGFTPVDPGLARDWNAAQPVAYVWLRHEPAPCARPADSPAEGG